MLCFNYCYINYKNDLILHFNLDQRWFKSYLYWFQIPIVLHKDLDRDDQGNPMIAPDGKQRYRCGFRIGGGIDQDNTKSPQRYPDKVHRTTYLSWLNHERHRKQLSH